MVQHFLGMNGMPRRIYTYPEGMGWDFWNLVSTIGSFIIALSVAIFVYNVFASLRSGEIAGNDPWDGRTLEWSIPSPPPHYNFAEIPIVRGRDPFWAQKYGDASHGVPVPVPVAGGAPSHGDAGYGAQPADHHHLNIHMPDPSIFPVFAALGFALALSGLLFGDPPFVGPAHAMPSIVTIVGLLTMIWGIFGWAMEPVSGY